MLTSVKNHKQATELKPLNLSIVAVGRARFNDFQLSEIRQGSAFDFPVLLSPQLLRHSDEQTLAALAAVADAIHGMPVEATEFGKWAIISAAQKLGQRAFATVIDKYQAEGPWGVSVQVIPHCTAHAVAGTLSLALGSHGPCIGAGSSQNAEVEALLCAASILRNSDWHGAWILFTGWSPPLAINRQGIPTSNSACLATALAVVRESSSIPRGLIQLEVVRARTHVNSLTVAHQQDRRGLLRFLCEGENTGSWSSFLADNVRVRINLR